MFSHHLENQMSDAPVTYHRMDVLPTAKTCYYSDTVSYAGIKKKFHLLISFVFTSQVQKFKILDLQSVEKQECLIEFTTQ